MFVVMFVFNDNILNFKGVGRECELEYYRWIMGDLLINVFCLEFDFVIGFNGKLIMYCLFL